MSKEFAEAVSYYKMRPVEFVRSFLKAEPYPHQAEAMQAIADGNRRISIRSGRQVGKTSLLAWLSMWYEMTRADAKTLVTAPSASQLNDAYAPEFRKWVQRLPDELIDAWDVKQERFDLKFHARQGFENFVTIRTARKDSPESLQGINARGGVLVLVDEAAGVDDPLFESISGSMANDNSVMLLTGNPNRASGYFHLTHTALSDQWYTLHVNSENVPSVSRAWIDEMQLKYGVHSNAYRIHVLGEFPTGDDDTVISLELIEAAVNRDVATTMKQPKVWGVDVARFGDDGSALCERQGNTVTLPVKVWRNLDTMELAGRIKAEWDLRDVPDRPMEILVDSIGIGAGVVDRLREEGLPVRGINVSESPSTTGHYANLKAELWDKARAWFEKRDCKIPKDDQLVSELAMIRKDYSPSGKLQIESKKDLKKRGAASPDRADAFVLTFASSAANMAYGWGYRTKGALKRAIKGVV